MCDTKRSIDPVIKMIGKKTKKSKLRKTNSFFLKKKIICFAKVETEHTLQYSK